MTNEKDREIAGIIRSECFIDISQTERPCFEWDLDTAANVIAKYRTEAVKAERDRIKKTIQGKLKGMKLVAPGMSGPLYKFTMDQWAMREVLKLVDFEDAAILSPDQGTDEKEADNG